MKISRLLLTLAFASLLLVSAEGRADSWYEDLTMEVKSMQIDFVDLGGVEMKPSFDRDQYMISAGRGKATFGLIYQETSKGPDTVPGVPDEGLMAHVGYDHILSYRTRLDLRARVGLLGTDEYQPLYSEDTDVQANLVWFDPDGFGYVKGQPFFPSAYVGTIINDFGRVQAVGGVGLWWRKIGLYSTAFHAFNGDEPVFGEAGLEPINFANLRNQGFSVSASYEWRALELRLKRNFALENGSDDISFAITFRHNPYRSID